MSDPDTQRRLDAIRLELRAESTRAELVTIKDAFWAAQFGTTSPDKLSTILISTNFGASGGTAALSGLQPLDVVKICRELIAEMDRAGVTSWTSAQSAHYSGPSAFTPVNFGGTIYQNGSGVGL